MKRRGNGGVRTTPFFLSTISRLFIFPLFSFINCFFPSFIYLLKKNELLLLLIIKTKRAIKVQLLFFKEWRPSVAYQLTKHFKTGDHHHQDWKPVRKTQQQRRRRRWQSRWRRRSKRRKNLYGNSIRSLSTARRGALKLEWEGTFNPLYTFLIYFNHLWTAPPSSTFFLFKHSSHSGFFFITWMK